MGQAVERVLDTLEDKITGQATISVETLLAALGGRALTVEDGLLPSLTLALAALDVALR